MTAIDHQIKAQVIKQWLSGDTRDRIAADNGIGQGTVSNILDDWKRGLDHREYHSIRELAVWSKKEGLTLAELATCIRINNHVKKLGANEEQIEYLIVNLLDGAKSTPPEKIVDLIDQLFEISKLESIAPAEVPGFVKQKMEVRQRLEEEIQQAGAILESKNVNIQTVEEYKELEKELNTNGLSMEDIHILVSLLQTIRQLGYDPQKIVSDLKRVKSLRQTEKQLENNCEKYVSRITRYRDLLPLCEELVSFGIGFPELLAFHSAVLKKTDMENLRMDTARLSCSGGN